ncbi:serum amyloid A-5 protein-like [Parasteatoda tepidariorum]|uniref:serum amyloid A-5 protein-like n=1 Tax=Parasteatoda tepidariorum TaxID=114398 RepID=UPI00077FCF09|nr:serum amyloid A-5 protein-like [Parasteatoda tepidariorum]
MLVSFCIYISFGCRDFIIVIVSISKHQFRDNSKRMRLLTSVLFLVVCVLFYINSAECQFNFMKQAGQGARDMWRAYSDMRDANWKGADKYFHARGNHDAAQRGPGGKWAAEVISNTREAFQGPNTADSKADQAANKWGREGGDPNKFRPKGLPDKY